MTENLQRPDGRRPDQLRPVRITPGSQPFAEGSAMIEMGDTAVLCAASVEEQVPRWMRGRGTGWVTAEYDMLPRATSSRRSRDRDTGRTASRSQEIQRLIGRSLRAATDLPALGERAIYLDCDVLQADGGTRTAAITGAYVALHQALQGLVNEDKLERIPLHCAVAAVSVGLKDGNLLLDLNYAEDSSADADFNIVMTDAGDIVEIQGTAEGRPFPRRQVEEAIALAAQGMEQLFAAQRGCIAPAA
ncbi:MAG: ribonuclease PH [Chloroflexi bacterium]|nr:ribonuclease PH [Chloroflexota bacterium]MYD49733.1 ribonuclease PH [Chloroflexota bacterium]